MINLKIPSKLENKLSENQELEGIVKHTAAKFATILDENKLFFFPEYTDHGLKHIEGVLKAADNLITNATYEKIITCEDVAYLILSVLLHDIGMHIHYEGFIKLVNNEFDHSTSDYFDDLDWNKEWSEYIKEARKFDEETIIGIFGKSDIIISDPSLKDKGDITENDKYLIGEFIRRKHPRIANEIATHGFPGSEIISFGDGLDYEILELVGVIARSHGMELRIALEYLEKKYYKAARFPHNCHAAFLMVVLRIADFIQIDSSRTSKLTLQTRSLASPISYIEHQAHLAINFLDIKYQNDPERIYVECSPTNSEMYLKLEKLVSDIQYEFDVSWAIIGELYGNWEIKPEIKYRRIKSNLHWESLLEKIDYVPKSFQFTTNNQLIKLLIGPLYGEDPKYGVRELLQNAVDACLEREYLIDDDYEAKIEVSINESDTEYFFSIKDNGRGMTHTEISRYFLNAGSSYRSSPDWLKKFTSFEGESKVMRNGKFGVGLLAAFLLGDRIEVFTRTKGSEGYFFSTTLNENHINVQKKSGLEIGTEIRIKISEKIKNRLLSKRSSGESWSDNIRWNEWFTLQYPKVNYTVFGQSVSGINTEPSFTSEDLANWHKVDAPPYESILWTYDLSSIGRNFTNNGIIIPEAWSQISKERRLFFNVPKISVFDFNDHIPISLDRNGLTRTWELPQEVLLDLSKDYVAYLLSSDHLSTVLDYKIVFRTDGSLGYPGGVSSNDTKGRYGRYLYENESAFSGNLNQYLISKNGFLPNYNYFLKRVGRIQVINLNCVEDEFPFELMLDIENKFLQFSDVRIGSSSGLTNLLIPRQGRSLEELIEPDYTQDARFFVLEKQRNILSQKSKKIPFWFRDKQLRHEGNYGRWYRYECGDPKRSIVTRQMLKLLSEKFNFIKEYEIDCDIDGNEILDGVLHTYLGDDVLIPYSMEERRSKYSKAFRELKMYMKKYR